MKRKAIVLLSSVLASGLLVGGAFAANYAVTDSADPIGVNITAGDLEEDKTDYVTLKWGSGTELNGVGNLIVGQNRKVGVVNLVTEGNNYEGVFSLNIQDKTTPKNAVDAKYMFDYLHVYLYTGAVNLTDQGALPAEGLKAEIKPADEADEDGYKEIKFNVEAFTDSNTEFTVFVSLDSTATQYYDTFSKDKVRMTADWGAKEGDEATDNLVYAFKPSGWAGLYAYAWSPTGKNAEWPGVAMVNVYDNVYSISIPTGSTGIIFNEGDFEGAQQTDDINFNGYSAAHAYWNGTAWDKVPGKAAASVTCTVNGEPVAITNIKAPTSTDKAKYNLALKEGDKVRFYDDEEPISFYYYDSDKEEEVLIGAEATITKDASYDFYYNAQGRMFYFEASEGNLDLGAWSEADPVIFCHPWGLAGDLGDFKVEGNVLALPEGTTGFNLVRMPTDSTELDWDTAWNESINLVPGDGTLTFKAWGEGDAPSVFEWVA